MAILALFGWGLAACSDSTTGSEGCPEGFVLRGNVCDPEPGGGGDDAGPGADTETDAAGDAGDDVGDGGCRADDDCDEGLFCAADGSCEEGCRFDGCADGELCDPSSRACVECVRDADCADQANYCDTESSTCVPGCRVFEPTCEPGQICDRATRECRPFCLGDSQCEENEYCKLDSEDADDPTLNTCIEGCRIEPDSCAVVGQICDSVTRTCREAGCDEDADCKDDEWCDPVDGSCRIGCRTEPDSCEGANEICDRETRECRRCGCDECGGCEPGYLCEGSVCVFGCADDTDCSDGKTCIDGLCGCVSTRDCADVGDDLVCSDGACIPVCTGPESCEDDSFCSCETGLCTTGCRADAFEPNNRCDDGASIELGSLVPGRLCGAEEDWFTIEVESTTRLRFDLLHGPLSPTQAPSFELRGADCRRLAESVRLSERESGLLLDTPVPPGEYKVRVLSNPVDCGTNDYTLLVQEVEDEFCRGDFTDVADEVNGDDLENAHAIGFDDVGGRLSATVPGLTLPNDDEDWFQIPVRAGDVIIVEIDPIVTGDGEVRYELLDLGGEAFGEGSSAVTGSDRQTISALVDYDGVAYLRVAWDGEATDEMCNEYTLFFVLGGRDCERDTDEPNDTADTCARLFLDPEGRTGRTGRVLCPGDRDVFCVNVAGRSNLSLEVTQTPITRTVEATISFLTPSGEVGDSWTVDTAGTRRTLEVDDVPGGNYLIEFALDGVEPDPFAYNFEFNATSPITCESDDFEPSNTVPVPITESIAAGTPIDANFCPGDPVDLCRFTEAENALCSGSLTNNATGTVPVLSVEVTDARGGLVAGGDVLPGSTAPLEDVLVRGGDPYTIRIAPAGPVGNDGADYSLSISCEPTAGCTADRFAGAGGNHTAEDAEAVEAGSYSALTLCPAATCDFFALPIDDGLRRIDATVSRTDATPIELALLAGGADDDAPGFAACTAGRDVSCTIAHDYLGVEGSFAIVRVCAGGELEGEGTAYTLRLGRGVGAFECEDDSDGPDETLASAQPLTVDGLSDLVLCQADTDTFRFTVPREDTYQVDLIDAEDPARAVEIAVFRNGVEVSREIFQAGSAQVLFAAEASDVFAIQIRNAFPPADEPMSYGLSVESFGLDDDCSGDPNEPNNSMGRATPLAWNEQIPGAICAATEDADWFALADDEDRPIDYTPTQGAFFAINPSGTPAGAVSPRPDVELSYEGESLLRSTTFAPHAQAFVLPSAAWSAPPREATIGLTGPSGPVSDTAYIARGVLYRGCSTADDESTGAPSAEEVTDGDFTQSVVCGAVDEDWFYVDLEAGDTVAFQVFVSIDTLGDLDFALFDSAVDTLSLATNPPRRFAWTVPARGTIVTVLANEEADADGRYYLRVRRAIADAAETPANIAVTLP